MSSSFANCKLSMTSELAHLVLFLWLSPFLFFYLVKADIFLFFKGLLPLTPSSLFVLWSLPLFYGVWLISLRGNRFVLLLSSCRIVLLPFWFMVISALFGIIVRSGELPANAILVFLPVLDFYVFLVGLVIGGLLYDRKIWTMIS